MKLKRSDIKVLVEQLSKYATATHPKVAYFVSVNALRARKCLDEADALTAVGWPTDAFKTWQEASKGVVEAHAARDDKDAIIWDDIPGGKRVRIIDGAAFDAEIAELRKEHPQAMSDAAAHDARVAEIWASEDEFREHRLSAQVAADAGVLTAETLAYLMRLGLIEDDEN
jgi:hypothetical protein